MNVRLLAAAERVVTNLFTFSLHSRGSFRTTGLARLFFGLVLRLELFRGERLFGGAFVGVPVGLTREGILETGAVFESTRVRERSSSVFTSYFPSPRVHSRSTIPSRPRRSRATSPRQRVSSIRGLRSIRCIETSRETTIRARARRRDAPSDDGSVGAHLHARADGNDVGGHGDHGVGVETMRHNLTKNFDTRGDVFDFSRGGLLDES